MFLDSLYTYGLVGFLEYGTDLGLRDMYIHMSYSLNSLKGGYIGDCIGTTIGVIKGDTRSLDYSSDIYI